MTADTGHTSRDDHGHRDRLGALARVRSAPPLVGLVGLVGLVAWPAGATLLAGCNEDLGVDDVTWACERDEQCGAGWICRQPAGVAQRLCVLAATWTEPDGGGLDAADGVGPDVGTDVGTDAVLTDLGPSPDTDGDAGTGGDATDAGPEPGDTVSDAGEDAMNDAADATVDGGEDADTGGSCDGCPEGFLCIQGACEGQDRVYVPGGPFAMGCNGVLDSLCGSFAAEAPQHLVTVPPFVMGKTEVTVAAYQACVTAGSCTAAAGESPLCNVVGSGVDDHPVNCVTRDQAAAYCAYAGGRLCSEAEWEKAARGGCEKSLTPCLETVRTYPWGEAAPTCDLAVMNDPATDTGCGSGTTMPVGSKPQGRSPYGALDMAGNVLDWVADCAHPTYDGAPSDGSAWTQDACSSGLLRGGSFEHTAPLLRSSARLEVSLSSPVSHSFGIRCCFPAP